MTFKDLELIDPILKALSAEGYTQPTPIQEQSIPILLKKKDLLGCAQTGTGKTAAFACPILQHLYLNRQKSKQGRNIRALVVTPTRELAIQIADSFTTYGKFTGIKNTVIFGGVKQGSQTDALRKGVDVLVATPGRLLDLMNQGFITLKHIEYFVLDEADHMLDMGFIHDIRKVIAKLPSKRQSLFFSATMPKDIVALSQKILGNPSKVTIQPEQTTAEKVRQAIYFTGRKGKPQLLAHLLINDSIDSVLVFSRTKHGANKIVKTLAKAEIKAEAIHGNKSQSARQLALSNFKSGITKVLIATDIAARGIDIDDMSHVINFDLPNIPETYVHRIGRTGRAGASGIAISFCEKEERPYLRDIEKLIGQKIPVVSDHPFPDDGTDEPRKQRQQRPPRKKTEGDSSKPANKNRGRKPWSKNPASKGKNPYKRRRINSAKKD
jgi:ATP-dependent RNA helicase RhlE